MHSVKGNIQVFTLLKNTLDDIKVGIKHDFDEE
jgi:hypothetical protein